MLTRCYAQLILDLCVCPKRRGVLISIIQNLTSLKMISNFALFKIAFEGILFCCRFVSFWFPRDIKSFKNINIWILLICVRRLGVPFCYNYC